MKAWAEAANELKKQGKGAILDGFWPQVDSPEVINKHSPSKKKSGKMKARDQDVEVLEEQETWMTQTPVKSNDEQDERMASIEKAQANTSTLVTTLTEALGKTRMECSKVLVIANTAIGDPRRAVNALVKHLAALDEEIEAYEKVVENSETAASYLEAQVKKIAEQIAKLSNVPPNEMQIMMKMLADTAEKMKGHEEEAQASKEELKEARTRRLKAGKESELAQAKLKAQTSGGEKQQG
jgi:hypothetical protein